MKLWEVMRLLEEDPSRRFEYQDNQKKWILYADAGCYDDRVFCLLDCRGHEGELKTGYRIGSLHGNLSTLDNWQPVRQPVTWQEAIQAWGAGKTIRLVMLGWEQVWRPTNAVELNQSRIKDGNWYVEE